MPGTGGPPDPGALPLLTNGTALDLAVGLMALPAEVRPTEVGSPFTIPAPGYFSDASTQTHLHVAFVTPIDPSWTPPAGWAAPADAPSRKWRRPPSGAGERACRVRACEA